MKRWDDPEVKAWLDKGPKTWLLLTSLLNMPPIWMR